MPGLRRSVFLLALAAVLAIGVERLIVTDAEAVEATLHEAVRAAREGDFEALADTLDVAYEAGGRDREAMVAYARSLRGLYAPQALDLDVQRVAVEDDAARAEGRLRATVMGRAWVVGVGVDLVRRPDGWRIAAAGPTGWHP